MKHLYRLICLLAAIATMALAPARAQAPEARFAFVIGNDAYDGAPLKTSANDAGLIADTLKQIGFDVTGARNLDQDTLRASYREFLEKVAAAGPGAVAAVYLSGYGLQVEGENYFVPVGASVRGEADVALNAIRVSDLTRPLAALQARAGIVALDLAYDGPFAKQGAPLAPGLGLVDADPGSLIAFNAAPGVYAPTPSGDYGPYARALAEAIHVPGLPLNDIFARARSLVAEATRGAQMPWNDSKIDPAYALTQPAPENAGAPTASIAQINAARAKPIRDFPDAEAYAAALDRDTIGAYQDFLAAYPSSRYAKNVRGILAARREAVTWRRTTALNTPNAYWTYLRRYPRGPHVSDARRRLARLAAAEAPPADFAPLAYDIAPPPDDEVVYFDRPVPTYYDVGAPPPPRGYWSDAPGWWTPPPPPAYAEDEDEVYFLPEPVAPPPPRWWGAPAYVVAPPAPYEYRREGRGASVAPYIAIPAALAAGIVAGKLISNRQERREAGFNGFAPPPGGPRPIAPAPATRPGTPGVGQPARTPFLPPVNATPQTLNRLGINPQGQLAPVKGPPPAAGVGGPGGARPPLVPPPQAPQPPQTLPVQRPITPPITPGAGAQPPVKGLPPAGGAGPGQPGANPPIKGAPPVAGQPPGAGTAAPTRNLAPSGAPNTAQPGQNSRPGTQPPAKGQPPAAVTQPPALQQQEQARQRQQQLQIQQQQQRQQQLQIQQQQQRAQQQQTQQQEQARQRQQQLQIQQQQQRQQQMQIQQQQQRAQQQQMQQQEQARQRQQQMQIQMQQQQQQRAQQMQIQQQQQMQQRQMQIQQQQQQQRQMQQQQQQPRRPACGSPGLPPCR